MAEFQKDCDEYGCPSVLKQWKKVEDMLFAQVNPKDRKKTEKEKTECWDELCEKNGWDEPDKVKVPLLQFLMDMEKRAFSELKKHMGNADKGKWWEKRTHKAKEEELRQKLRVRTRVALTGKGVLSVSDKKREVELEKREEVTISGSKKGRVPVVTPPQSTVTATRLYPDLTDPPSYDGTREIANQQVMVTVKGEVDIEPQDEDIKTHLEGIMHEMKDLRAKLAEEAAKGRQALAEQEEIRRNHEQAERQRKKEAEEQTWKEEEARLQLEKQEEEEKEKEREAADKQRKREEEKEWWEKEKTRRNEERDLWEKEIQLQREQWKKDREEEIQRRKQQEYKGSSSNGVEGEQLMVNIRGRMTIEKEEEDLGDNGQGECVADNTRSRSRSREHVRRYDCGEPNQQLTGHEGGRSMQAPLVERAGKVDCYKPWTQTDMTAILAKLPP
ncbi:MAG: hypothetical protein ACRC6N_01520, partial [Plesiomonas sp.]|uniref:hypothetical protein n=1 Tax=Plesiomonas sp. TaxID=2486279 RepID=UPI003F39EA18